MKESIRLTLSIILLIISLPKSNAQKKWTLPQNNAKKYYANKIIRSEVIHLNNLSHYNLKQYYENGQLKSDEIWQDSVRHGLCKYYNPKAALVKEITFNRNSIQNYKSYKNNALYCHINTDRSIIVNKGKTLKLDFGTYYELDNSGLIMPFSKINAIDYLLIVMMPEEVTQVMEDKFSKFLENNPHVPGSDIISCNEGQQLFDDKGVSLTASSPNLNTKNSTFNKNLSNNNSSIGKFNPNPQAGGLAKDIFNKCGANSAALNGGNSLTPKYSNLEQSARQTIQQMISSCKSASNFNDKNGMIGVDQNDADNVAKLATGVSAIRNFSQWTATLVIQNTGGAAGTAIAPIIEAAGFGTAETTFNLIAADVLAVTTGPVVAVVAAGASGYSAGTLLNKLFFDKIVQKAFDGILTKESNAIAAEVTATREAQEKAAKEAKEATENKEPKKDDKNTIKTPLPDGENHDPCQAMENFYNQCERSNWKEYRCANFVRLINKCAGDIRVINPSPDGTDLFAVGCKSGENKEKLNELECRKKGMIMTPTEGSRGCIKGTLKVDIISKANDPRITDPVNPGFSRTLSQNNFASIDKIQLSTKLSSAKSVIVVFADKSCPFSESHLQNFSGTAKTLEVCVIEVSEQSILADEYQINVVPTTFTVKNGKLTNRKEGGMSTDDAKKYTSDSNK
jgi:hypothetical protein